MRRELAGAVAVVALIGVASAGGDAPARRNAGVPGVVRGFVDRGEHDVPESGRTVTLLSGGLPARTTTTDGWGRFSFDGVAPDVACELRVEADGCATVRVPGVLLIPGETRDVGELWLGPPGAFDAFVADEKGAPIAGATVEAFRESADGEDGWIDRARLDVARTPSAVSTTDATGHAALAVARGARWTVAARATGRARAAFARLGAGGTGPRRIEFELPKAERLTGLVVDSAGRPIPAAVVVARRSILAWGTCGTCSPLEEGAALWQSSVADATGRFAFDALPPGRIQLLAAPRGGSPAYAGSVEFPDAREIDVALPATATIVGRFTDETTGAPVAGVVVAATGGGVDTASRAVTDIDGAYVLTGVPAGDRIALSIRPAEGWTGARCTGLSRDDLVLRGGQTARIDATLQRAAVVSGRVTCDGAPAAAAIVRVTSLPEDDDKLFGRVVDGRTDAQGAYRVEGVLPGTVAVFALAVGDDQSKAWDVFYKTVVQDRAGRAREGFSAPPGATAQRDVAIGRTPVDSSKERVAEAFGRGPDADTDKLHVRCRITTADGLPLVEARYASGGSAEDAERHLGSFWYRSPPGGLIDEQTPRRNLGRTLSIAAIDDRHASGTTTVEIPADAREIAVEIVLPARPSLRGRVVSGGKPLAGASISLVGAAVARTAADGTFVAHCAADATIGVEARGFVRRMFKDVRASDDGVVELELDPAASIGGRVVDASGQPVAGLSVTPIDGEGDVVRPYCGWRAAAPPELPVTDAEGRFLLDEMPPGEWRLRVKSALGAAVGVETFVTDRVAAGTLDVRIEVRPERRIAGRVVGPEGRPARDAKVVCTPGPGDAENIEARTDDRGRFGFVGLADREYVIDVAPPWKSEAAPARRRVKSGTTDVEIAMTAAATISGVVVAENGEPFERSLVEAIRLDEPNDDPKWPRDLEEYTDEKTGAFRIVVPPAARFRLVFGRRYSARAILRGGDDVASGAKDLRLVADTALSIAGVAVDENGRPVADADVEARISFSDLRRGRSDAAGRWALTGLTPCNLCVVVQSDGRVPVRLFGVAAGKTDLRIVLRPGLTITGRLLDAAGKPAKNRSVRAMSPAWPAADLWRAQPDEDGRFEIKGLDAGEWNVESFVPGCMVVNDVVVHGKFKAGARDLELRPTK